MSASSQSSIRVRPLVKSIESKYSGYKILVSSSFHALRRSTKTFRAEGKIELVDKSTIEVIAYAEDAGTSYEPTCIEFSEGQMIKMLEQLEVEAAVQVPVINQGRELEKEILSKTKLFLDNSPRKQKGPVIGVESDIDAKNLFSQATGI